MAFFGAGGVRLYLAVAENERSRSRPVSYYGVTDLDGAYETPWLVEPWKYGPRLARRRHRGVVDHLCLRSGRDTDRPESGAGELTARVWLG